MSGRQDWDHPAGRPPARLGGPCGAQRGATPSSWNRNSYYFKDIYESSPFYSRPCIKLSVVAMTPLNMGRNLQFGESGDSDNYKWGAQGQADPKVRPLSCTPSQALACSQLLGRLLCAPTVTRITPIFLAKNKVCSFPDLQGNSQEE